MPAKQSSGASLLEHAYEVLDLYGDDLIKSGGASPADVAQDVWREVGDWLLLGDRVGADRIFFLHNDPVIVFSSLPSHADETDVLTLYKRAWSMARPRCLFLAIGFELRVYGLDSPPPVTADDELTDKLTPLQVVTKAADVAEALQRFHRDSLESGATFEHEQIASTSGRADQRLLRDVQVATEALTEKGLPRRNAHALIERAILVRYLEDREVLTPDYFEPFRPDQDAFDSPPPIEGSPSTFIKCLESRSHTFKLFDQLAKDFNGDLFVADRGEKTVIKQQHLSLLRDLLLGVSGSAQEPLFLWAYDFSVVPTSLVSTMYELFYNEDSSQGASNTHYTPPELVEFVLGDLLTEAVLAASPRVCDPACGSGIFLVEAYRRIVRFEAASQGTQLSTDRLRDLLLDRVAGCDIDEDAVRLAAFSLYVAFLNYQTPHDIRSAGPLPPLIARTDGASGPLLVGDAFTLEFPSKRDDGEEAEAPGEFDVIVGNPPWSEPAGPRSDAEIWTQKKHLPVGDRSPSQLFLWRALDLLRDGGTASLLVSAKVLYNVRSTSREFREHWLSNVQLQRVVNFSDVRRDYFSKGVAPFALIRFRKSFLDQNNFIYESARRVPVGRRGSLALARLDRRIASQNSLRAHDFLWKTYSAGGRRDEALVVRLKAETHLGDLLAENPRQRFGYQRATKGASGAYPPDPRWRNYPSLANFESVGPLHADWFEDIPSYVKRAPDPELFRVRRLLVRRGIKDDLGPPARLLEQPMAFRHTTYAFPLQNQKKWVAQVALGIILSSVGRYWLYMVSGSWGTWSDDLRLETLLDLPVRLDYRDRATKKIISVVKQLPEADNSPPDLFNSGSSADPEVLMTELDQAVSDLFELTDSERDRVADFWNSRAPSASEPITDLRDSDELSQYLDVFLRSWQAELGDDVALDVATWTDSRADVIATVFETRDPTPEPTRQEMANGDWTTVLDRFGPGLLGEASGGMLLTYGVLRAVTDTGIVVVKRNERRLFSRTAAREDAEATIAQAIALQRQ